MARQAVGTSLLRVGGLRREERILALLSAHLIVVNGWRGGWREDYADLDDSARDMMLQCPTAVMARDQAAMGRGVFAAINQAAKSRAVLAPH